MSTPVRRSEVVEQDYTQMITAIIAGVVGLLLTLGVLNYVGSIVFGLLLGIPSFLALVFGGYKLYLTTQVPSYALPCPYCKRPQVFTAPPQADFACDDCHRIVALENGQPLPVTSINCSHCSTLNYYTSKSHGLKCEECGRDIQLPHLQAPQTPYVPPSQQAAPTPPAVVEDSREYEIILQEVGPQPDQVLRELQSLLNLTSAQVKKTLESLPQPLFVGINSHRAALIGQRLKDAGAVVEVVALPSEFDTQN